MYGLWLLFRLYDYLVLIYLEYQSCCLFSIQGSGRDYRTLCATLTIMLLLFLSYRMEIKVGFGQNRVTSEIKDYIRELKQRLWGKIFLSQSLSLYHHVTKHLIIVESSNFYHSYFERVYKHWSPTKKFLSILPFKTYIQNIILNIWLNWVLNVKISRFFLTLCI